MNEPQAVEFWPDYSGALLFLDGRRVEPADLSIPDDVALRAAAWLQKYDDSKLPSGDNPDLDWVAEGRALFLMLRDRLPRGFTLTDWEGFWGPEAPDADGTE
jgi:hypothetical protein